MRLKSILRYTNYPGVKVSFYLCYLPWIQRDRTTEFDLLLWLKKLQGQYNDDISQKSLAFQTVYPMLPVKFVKNIQQI